MMLTVTLWLIAQAASPPAQPLPAFLPGCWEEIRGERWIEECWTTSRGGMMMGSGRIGQAGSVLDWEWMKIERAADGTLTFTASPKGAKPVTFKSTKVSENEVEFLNSAHDYPQRIRYVRTTSGMEAETSLADGDRAVRWNYRRMGSPTGN